MGLYKTTTKTTGVVIEETGNIIVHGAQATSNGVNLLNKLAIHGNNRADIWCKYDLEMFAEEQENERDIRRLELAKEKLQFQTELQQFKDDNNID